MEDADGVVEFGQIGVTFALGARVRGISFFLNLGDLLVEVLEHLNEVTDGLSGLEVHLNGFEQGVAEVRLVELDRNQKQTSCIACLYWTEVALTLMATRRMAILMTNYKINISVLSGESIRVL